MNTVNSEYTFPDPSGTRIPFPSVFANPEKSLTVVVPAYNEEERLPSMMNETLAYLEAQCAKEPGFSYEVIVADDGSRDRTSDVAYEYTKAYSSDKVRVLRLIKNAGKGGAVKRGVMAARGAAILFCDADGATRFSDLAKLRLAYDQMMRQSGASDGSAAICVIGSRYLANASVERTLARRIVSEGFRYYVQIVAGVTGIKDTQCGFKLFSRAAAQIVFPGQHLERWAFDVEILYRAQLANIPIQEVAVQWTEIPGSKLSVIKATLNMSRDMAYMRWQYLTGAWSASDLAVSAR